MSREAKAIWKRVLARIQPEIPEKVPTRLIGHEILRKYGNVLDKALLEEEYVGDGDWFFICAEDVRTRDMKKLCKFVNATMGIIGGVMIFALAAGCRIPADLWQIWITSVVALSCIEHGFDL